MASTGRSASSRAAHEIDFERVAARFRRRRKLACGASPYNAGSTSSPPVSRRPSTPRSASAVALVERERPWRGPGAADGGLVVARLLAGVMATIGMQAPIARYIRAGTSTPIRSSARVSWART